MYRSGDLVDFSVLSQKKVAILGAGSVGGYVAHFLPPGLQALFLVDHEVLGEENVERHMAGQLFVGQPKVEATRLRLLEHYGDRASHIVALQCQGEDALAELVDVDLVIEATNDPALRFNLNIWAQDYDKPVIYVGIYAGGSGWQTITLPNPKELCYQCVELSRTNEDQDRDELLDYGIAPHLVINQLHAAPGLVSSVVPAAAMTAKLATDLLMGRALEAPIFRCTYQSKAIMRLHDETDIKVAKLMIDLQHQLGFNQFELIADNAGFTLEQKSGSIPLTIRQAAGCPLHRAPKRRQRR